MVGGFTRITPADEDPVAAAFVDEENEQSIDPLLELEGQSVDPVPDDPARDLLDELTDIGERVKAVTSDPIPLLVAEIHEEIERLLWLQRDICDGIELATDQVQDKRIEFLEAGPEATLADIFIEFALVFFLESPVLGAVIRRAYRFVGARILGDRVAKLQSLKEAAEGIRDQMKKNFDALKRNRRELTEVLNELPDAVSGRYLKLVDARDRLRDERKSLLVRHRELERIFEPPEVFQEKSEVTERKLRKFFSEVREKAIGDYGVAVTKATKTAEEKSDLGDQTVAADTIGVQVKSLAQFHLRNMELHLGLAAADADMLRAIALGDPLLAPDCFVLLSQMKAALQEARPGKPLAGLDARHSAKIEFEKLIWALLIPNDPRLSPTEIKEITETAGIQTGPGERATAGGAVLSAELRRPQPPPRLVKYWGERFFAGEKLDDEEIKERLRKLKADFLAKSDSERLIQVNSVPFKEET